MRHDRSTDEDHQTSNDDGPRYLHFAKDDGPRYLHFAKDDTQNYAEQRPAYCNRSDKVFFDFCVVRCHPTDRVVD
mgnify:CR=1 FL=1